MTPTTFATAPQAPGAACRLPAALRAVAIAACVPYVTLKAAWIAGSRIGIPEGSVLLEHRGTMIVANGVTLLMDACVVLLALLLTRPWGLRVRAWLLAAPIWVATGLLGPIMVGFPLQLAVAALGGSTSVEEASEAAFLDSWVFAVVYGGFIAQGLALGGLFVLYARARWSRVWRGRIWDLPSAATGPFMRAAVAAGALAALGPAVLHVMWALGADVGLPAETASSGTAGFRVLEAVRVLFAALALGGAVSLAFRRFPGTRVRTALAAAWTGSAALGAWGGYLTLVALLPVSDGTGGVSALPSLAYAVEMVSGALFACGIASLLRRRGTA
ncbi:hypothetical protein [Streptomyces sp. MUM 178J]|uniref:hypothetical protein n=1 Tax=Streptomyces sp. MUM 178J TaxID=2791991 RepID=UPI001F0483A6|nr:hypothetical protein [Streptomyces sp. MUM 178J]WRQ78817.1 hypothetical protein I3F59_005155 [Streptomyces sp. MUM 178J]